jgi:hypothetical protein
LRRLDAEPDAVERGKEDQSQHRSGSRAPMKVYASDHQNAERVSGMQANTAAKRG